MTNDARPLRRSHIGWLLILFLVVAPATAWLTSRATSHAAPVAVSAGTTEVEPAPAPRTHVVLGSDQGPVAFDDGTVAETPAPKPSSSPDKPDAEKKDVPLYLTYIKDPDSLGFSPDVSLFQTVYSQVKNQHIDRDPDDKLFAGVIKEVGRLLKESRVADTGLDTVPRDRTAPQRIIGLYGDKVSKDLLWYAMIRGLLEGTDDPYSVLMTPKEYHMLMEQMQNEAFGGVGIYIELDKDKDDQLTVVEPLEGTPACAAGLLPGDQVIKINGEITKGITIDMATAKIRGPVGSQVVLTIQRPGIKDLKDYAITRAQIEVASVSRKMLPGGVGYVRLRLFGAKTGAELSDALSSLEKAGARALILDLRNNGGGYINAAIDVCSNFVDPGSLVTFVTDRRDVRKDYTAVPRPRDKLPMILLVNNFSASASEITAGCLKDYKRATLMGVKTFGKGSVQQLYPLPSGAALKLTIAHFFTPQGNKINKIGVEPDVKVEMEARNVGRGDKDTQLQQAIDYLKKQKII